MGVLKKCISLVNKEIDNLIGLPTYKIQKLETLFHRNQFSCLPATNRQNIFIFIKWSSLLIVSINNYFDVSRDTEKKRKRLVKVVESLRLSVCLYFSVSLSVSPSVCLSVSIFLFVFLLLKQLFCYLSVWLYFYTCLSVVAFACLSFIFVCLCLCYFLCLSCLSPCFWFVCLYCLHRYSCYIRLFYSIL